MGSCLSLPNTTTAFLARLKTPSTTLQRVDNKAAGIVSYGSAYGARSAEVLRMVMRKFMIAEVRQQVLLSLFTDFENYSKFNPDPRSEKSLNTMLDQVVAWSAALKTLAGRKIGLVS
jgi:NAD(P)H-dependent FMN reductase